MSINKKGVLCTSGDKLVLPAAIAMVFTLLTILNKNFFSATSMINILIVVPLVGLVAIGHTYLAVAGQNDLSPGPLAASSGIMAALLAGKGFSFGSVVLLVIAYGIMIGCFGAFMVSRVHPEAFIATFVIQSIVRGFVYIICGGKPTSISSWSLLILGKARIANIPLSVWTMILCIVISGIILARTKFDRSVYAIGGSMDVARSTGPNFKRIITTCYTIMGVLCSIGGIIFMVRMNLGQPAANVNLEFSAITAVTLGGVSFIDDVGDMGGTILGVILVQALNTGLMMVSVPTFWQYVAKDGLLLFALTTNYIRK